MSRNTLVDVYELTPMQQGMLFHRLYAPADGFYVEQTVLTMTGKLDHEAFWRSWQLLVDRHDALRTAFRWEGIAKPVQAVHARAELSRVEHDWRDLAPEQQERRLEELLLRERRHGFDLETPPIMRVALCRLADDRFHLALRLSHLVVDGWSIGLLLSEFTAAYKAYARGAEPVLAPAGRFRDYVAWWKRQDPADVAPFWRRYLADLAPPAPLWLGGEAGIADPIRSFDRVQVPLGVDLREFSQRHRLTPHTLVQGAWTLVLGRTIGATDVTVGTTFAHRPTEVPGGESIVGCMVGTVPVRSSIAPDREILDWLRAIQDDIIAVRDNSATGLAEIHRSSQAPAGSQLFESIFGFQNMPLPAFTLGEEGLGLEGYDMHTRPHTPLVVLVLPGEEMPLRLIFDRRRVGREQAHALVEAVRSVLRSIVRDGATRIGELAVPAIESGPMVEASTVEVEAVATGETPTETEAALCAIFAELLRLDRVGPHDNLVELGLHSLLGTRAANRIRDRWQTALPLQALFERPTAAGLARLIEAGGVAEDRVRDARPQVDLVAEAVLDPDIVPRGTYAWKPVPERILVTGATGYLGSAVLERLLRTTPATVVCLVRSLDPEEGRRRVRDALAAASRWDDAFADRIEVLPGNLSQPRFGLDGAAFAALARSVDEIYHLGAVVNTMPPYRRLRATNVCGTQEVLRLAATADPIPVYYISPGEISDVPDPLRNGREVHATEPPPYLYNGYIQSQWVADKIVGEAARRGLPVVVCRAARLVGSPVTGRWKLGDVVGDIMRGCVALGLVPESDLALPVSTVEHVAASMVALGRAPGAAGRCFHLTTARPFTFPELAAALEDCGYPAKPVPMQQWYAELVRLSERDPDGRWDVVLSVLGPWVRATGDGWREPLYDTTEARAAIGGAVPSPDLDRGYIAACLDHLAEIGYLPKPAAAPVRG